MFVVFQIYRCCCCFSFLVDVTINFMTVKCNNLRTLCQSGDQFSIAILKSQAKLLICFINAQIKCRCYQK